MRSTIFSRICCLPHDMPERPAQIELSRLMLDGSALQSAIFNDYLPLLSDVLQADGQTAQPFRAVIRKGKPRFHFQICNHNLLLADAIHRGTGRRPILPDSCAVIIDEVHKLPETARQMFGVTLEAGDIHALVHALRNAKYFLAAETLDNEQRMSRGNFQNTAHGRPEDHFCSLMYSPTRF